jgi:hypothetical protein
MTERQDPDLNARFAAQRRVDASRAPSFAAMMARAQDTAEPVVRADRHMWLPRRYAWTGAVAAAAAIVALIMVPWTRSGDDAFEQAVRTFSSDPALGAWQSPTAGLLDLPGDGLLTSIPSVGTVQQ